MQQREYNRLYARIRRAKTAEEREQARTNLNLAIRRHQIGPFTRSNTLKPIPVVDAHTGKREYNRVYRLWRLDRATSYELRDARIAWRNARDTEKER